MIMRANSGRKWSRITIDPDEPNYTKLVLEMNILKTIPSDYMT